MLGTTAIVAASHALADETTVSVDNARTGWDANEPGLSPSAVSSSNFGQVFRTQLDGQVYAQPVVAAGTLVAATESNNVYGLDPKTGAIAWQRNLGPAWPASTLSCGDLAPNVGVTATPVYDPATHAVYLTAKVNNGVDVQHPNWYMHALDITTGAERAGFPVPIQGAPSNDPTTVFDPLKQMQRPGLLLLNGVIYAGFGAHCDIGPYRGYVVGVSTTKAQVTAMWATEAGASSSGAGIWQSGSGLTSDGAGRIIVATSNGISPAPGPGNAPPSTLAESVVRLQVDPTTGQLSPVDFFAPSNANTLDQNDTDFGSGGPVALPDSFGAGTSHPHLLVQAGKDGRVFLLDRDHLGGRGQGTGGGDAVVGVSGPYQGQWGHPAVWGGDGGYVYEIANSGPLRALKYGVTGAGVPALSLTGTSTATFGYTTGSPVVTSSGTTSGSALVWLVRASGPTGTGGTLLAYNPVPDANGILQQVFTAPIGTAAKFATPATDGNRVYVGTRDGTVVGFGQPATTVLSGSPVSFTPTAVGASTTQSAVLTATQSVTVTAVSTAAPFAVQAPSLPVTLPTGGQLTIPVSFTPSTPGTTTGVLNVTTSSGSVGLGLTGAATQPGLHAAPSTVSFPNQPTGSSTTTNVQVTNTGTSAEVVSAAAGTTGPFTTAGLPAVGTTVAPGNNVVITVTYLPTVAAQDSSQLSITSTSGTLTVPVTGNAVSGSGKLVLTPSTTNFGSVAIGSSSTLSFDIANTGNVAVTVSKAKAPISAFTSAAPLAEGLVIQPAQVVHQTVTFTPSVAGTVSDQYEITATDGQGAQYETLTGTGVATGNAVTVPAPDTNSWAINGTATLAAPTLTLTGNAAESAGTAFYRTPVAGFGIHASYTATFPATGGDGSSFAILDASKNPPTAVGTAGGGVGFSGLTGIGVVLGTYWTSGAASNNYVAIVTGPGTGADNLTYLAVAPVAAALRSGTHAVTVDAAGGHLSVAVDGTTLLDRLTALPPNVLLGFTAGAGSTPGVQTVSNVSITAGSTGTTTPTGQPLTAAPAAVTFGQQPTASSTTQNVILTNNGGVTETVSAVSPPATPFTAALPAPGTTLAPGTSTTVPVTFTPTTATSSTGTFTITTTSGTVTVALSGTGTASTLSSLQANTTTVTFGSVALNTTAARTVSLTNTGTTAQTVTASSGPAAPFTAAMPASGTTVAPGATVSVPVTFTPISASTSTGALSVTSTGGTVTVALTGTGAASGSTAVPPPDPTNWSINGGATLSGSTLTLTDGVTPQSAGTAFYRTPVPAAVLHASYTATFPAAGGDGSTFAILDSAANPPTAVGVAGGGLGFSRLTGLAVVLGTYWTAGAQSNNFIALAQGPGSSADNLTYQAVTPVPAPLRSGSHAVTVDVTGGAIVVSVDGTALLHQPVNLPPSVLLGFTAGDGQTAGQQTVGNVVLTAGAALSVSPTSLDFGAVTTGSSSTQSVAVRTSGTAAVTVSGTTAAAAPFSATLPAAGAAIPAGGSITIPVTFAPTATGAATSSISVATTGGTVTVPLAGTGVTSPTVGQLPSLSDPSWTRNGKATVTGTTATLTLAGQKYAAGSVVNSTSVRSSGLHATFTATLTSTSATGADGLTLAFLDPAHATSTALGASGNGLGLAGLAATYVSLQTYPENGVNSSSFAAIGTSTVGATKVSVVASNSGIGALRTGTHTVDVTATSAGHLVVLIDGKQVFDKAVVLPPTVLVAFTAGTGSLSDTHQVSAATVTYSTG